MHRRRGTLADADAVCTSASGRKLAGLHFDFVHYLLNVGNRPTLIWLLRLVPLVFRLEVALQRHNSFVSILGNVHRAQVMSGQRIVHGIFFIRMFALVAAGEGERATVWT